MKEYELKDWFWNLYNSCYVAKHIKCDYSDFLFYDENYIRTKKLNEILGTNIKYSSFNFDKCLFEIKYNFKVLYVCKEIYDLFYDFYLTENDKN